MAIELRNAASIHDLAAIARARIPEFALHYLDGGAGEDRGVRHNEAAFEQYRLKVKRLAGGAARIDTATTLFGQRYAFPFGVAPVGMANLMWPGTDLILAKIAQREKFPYVISTAGTTEIERICEAAPDVTWFQLYLSRKDEITDDLMRRCWDGGVRNLALTVDVPGPGRRNRGIRSNVDLPFRVTPGVMVDLMRHPAWSLATLSAGIPLVANYMAYANSKDFQVVGLYMGQLNKPEIVWDDLKRIRDRWKGNLLVKGVMDPDDATALVQAGVDGLWVSNHGGRQLEAAPATIDVVAGIRDAVGPAVPIVLDSGIRGGEDVVKAKALGADLVFSGRSFVYGTAAGGEAGGEKAVEIMKAETRAALVQTGCLSFAALDRSWIESGLALASNAPRRSPTLV